MARMKERAKNAFRKCAIDDVASSNKKQTDKAAVMERPDAAESATVLAVKVAERHGLISTSDDGVDIVGPNGFTNVRLTENGVELGGGSAISSGLFSVVGPNGFVSLYQDETGLWGAPQELSKPTAPGPSLEADRWAKTAAGAIRLPRSKTIMGVNPIGQSYERYANGAPGTTPYHVGPTLAGRLLMPSVGVVPNGQAFLSFIDLVEGGRPDFRLGESYLSEMGLHVFGALDAAFGAAAADIRMACVSTGIGSRDYPFMIPGGPIMAQWEANLRCCVAAAAARGEIYEILAVPCWQGQEDSLRDITLEERVQRILMLQADLQARAREILGQTRSLKLLILGPDRGYGDWRPNGVALATAEAARLAPDRVILASAGYEHETANGHPLNNGYRTAGVAIGQAIVEGALGAGYPALMFRGWNKISSNTIRIGATLRQNRSLVIDDGTGQVCSTSIATSKGWKIRWGDMSADRLISSVTLADTGFAGGTAKAIDLTTVEPIDFDTFEALYANNVPASGKARGLIRDDSPPVTLPGISYQTGRRWVAPSRISAQKGV